MSLITLLTDFGLEDEYAGVMKGAILSVNPDARIVDITHGIPPQDVFRASLVLEASVGYFPADTIHLAVVDPGVGSARTILAARNEQWTVVAPDNGLLGRLVPEDFRGELVAVENEAYFGSSVSHTFHGRDIFAPVGAHLALGLSLAVLGPPMDPRRLVRLNPMRAFIGEDGSLVGHVVTTDRFGNLITNIGEDLLMSFSRKRKGASFSIFIKNARVQGLSSSYAQGRAGELVALIGSRGTIELAVPGDSAARILMAGPGEIVRISFP